MYMGLGVYLDDCVCVCVIRLDSTTPPWWREKVMIYYYFIIWHHRLVSYSRTSGLLERQYSTFAQNTLMCMCSCTVSIIQCGYRKWGTHARVFSQTLAYGNSKNEIRQRDKKRCVSIARGKAGTKNEVPKV